jgi:hypothetical protein
VAWFLPVNYEECYQETNEFSYSVYESPKLRKTFIIDNHKVNRGLNYDGFECYLNEDGSVRLKMTDSIFVSDLSNSEKAGEISVSIAKPDKPDFGTFDTKADVISSIETQLRNLCQAVLKSNPGAILDIYVPDFREEFLDYCKPVIILNNKEIIALVVQNSRIQRFYIIHITEYEKMPLKDFDSRELDHIKRCAVLHFTYKN